MNVKDTVRQQYIRMIDEASHQLRDLTPASEGWITTMRKALGMTGTQMGKRVGITRAAISQSERNERDGVITVQQMQKLAEAMGGRYVHAIILPKPIDEILLEQARKKATATIKRSSAHMALESQSLSKAQNRIEIERLAQQLLLSQPSDFWDDK
ncbi:mobile mystery protein A [Agrobacterium vitis]|uniref:Mobile mystery protein A n=1 Tax=Agrobacterium vitis TaxID=373 RepID=A0A6L6VGH7_AGRVI|nr:mobile mystery protein A [Agrobacterium vitis]MVA19925.1 mobile mystery protein A [Agrobacterium vitis]